MPTDLSDETWLWELCEICGMPHHRDEMRPIQKKDGTPPDQFICRECDEESDEQ